MVLYKMEATLLHTDGAAEAKEDIAPTSLQGKLEEFRKQEQTCYLFVSSIRKGTHITLGLIAKTPVDPKQTLDAFLAHANLPCGETAAEEIALSTLHTLLRNAGRNEFVADTDKVLRTFGLEELLSCRDRFFQEGLIDETPSSEQEKQAASALSFEGSLRPELERISAPRVCGQSPTVVLGHPVHYMIRSEERAAGKQVAELLLGALLQNKRLAHRRYATVTMEPDNDVTEEDLDRLYAACEGGAILMECLPGDDEGRPFSEEDIRMLCRTMRKHKNRVLTVFCSPRRLPGEESLWEELLADIAMVRLDEDTLCGEQAKRYLCSLAEKHGVEAADALFQRVTGGEKESKGYLPAELDLEFQRWFDELLTTGIYPQYAAFSAKAQKEPKPVPQPEGDAYQTLKDMVGLAEAKTVMEQALDYYRAQKLFAGRMGGTRSVPMHMVFTGNPGTAKTTVARLFARIMKENGLLSRGELLEVGRADLVGKYVGWTAQIVKRKFKEAKGGVLFIDEAYSLLDGKNGQYGDEAINTIVQEMENHREDTVVIFAGYPKEMEGFLARNPGLRSRIAFHVPFEDYSPEELYGITELLAKGRSLSLEEQVKEKLLPIFTQARQEPDFGNGRFARNLLEKAAMKQASRLVRMQPEDVTDDDLLTLKAEDFEAPSRPAQRTSRQIGFFPARSA